MKLVLVLGLGQGLGGRRGGRGGGGLSLFSRPPNFTFAKPRKPRSLWINVYFTYHDITPEGKKRYYPGWVWKGTVKEWLQPPDSMWYVPSNFWQMGQIGGPSRLVGLLIWLHWAARAWLCIKSLRQSMAYFFSPGDTCIIPEWLAYVFLNCLPWSVLGNLCSILWTDGLCHAQLLAATNRVTEQLNWLTVESFFMSCSIIWMASLIDNLYLLDLIGLVINWQHVNCKRYQEVRGT